MPSKSETWNFGSAPFSPPSGPPRTLFQWLAAKSNFLEANLAIKEWIPDDEPDLDWFCRPRDPDTSDPDQFDQSPHGRNPKSRSVTVTPWFLKVPDSAHLGAQKPLPKAILAKRPERLRSSLMIFHPNAPNPARSGQGMGTLLSETPATDAPKHLFRPFSPRTRVFHALRSVPSALPAASRKKQIPSIHPSLEAIFELKNFGGLRQ
jgi:hypothetical protein